jgi:pimeloyl-ACP methyl ester carboxylesterase
MRGADGSRENVRPYAEMLARNGYGVLAPDLRGHGESENQRNRLAWQGTRDVGAAVDFVRERSEVQLIGGLGISMGAEALLGAASQYPAIEGIVADSATRRSIEELPALESEQPLVRNFTARVMYATVRALTDDKPPPPLPDSMVEARSTRFLAIAGGAKELEARSNEPFAETVGSRATLWVAPGASHAGASARYPDEYERRVIALFDAARLTGGRSRAAPLRPLSIVTAQPRSG